MQALYEPVVTIKGVKIRSLHLSSVDFDVMLRIENPNPFGATVKELPFVVFFRHGTGKKRSPADRQPKWISRQVTVSR